ncbi:MAG: DNA internalization-related competence protein ComEC/Rec2 [Oscillospiraceae bacterium]|nr:DNA internalization-related competence protein ComEC/Rec2 [Oscillospiraceae bacterium]
MRPLAFFAFAFSAGVFAVCYLPEKAAFAVVLSAAAALVVFAAVSEKGDRRRICAIIAAAFVAGALYSRAFVLLIQAPAEKLAGTDETVTLEIAGYAEKSSYRDVADAYLLTGNGKVKVRLYGGNTLEDLSPGDTVITDAKIKSASEIRGESITSFTSRGIWLLVYADGDMTVTQADSVPVKYYPLVLAKAVKQKIGELYSGDAEAFMKGILTGDRTDISDELYSAMTETGIMHITAVSGMHCAFLFGLVLLLTGKRRRMSALIGIPVLLVFMLMTGASPSVTRACIMLIVLSLAPIFNRENDYPTAMGFALLLILLKNPFAAQSVSLQLSFAAIAGILAFGSRCYRLFCPISAAREKGSPARRVGVKIWKFAAGSLSTTIGAMIFTLLLSMYYFGCFSVISPLTNLLCLWFASIAFALGMLSVIAGFILMPLAHIIAIIPQMFSDYILAVISVLSHVPEHAVYGANPYILLWLVYAYTMFAGCLLLKGRKSRYAVAAGLCAVSLAAVIALPRIEARNEKMEEIVINVGQGASAALVSDGSAVLVDCGSSNSWIDAGDRAADALQTLGYNKIDKLILTHYHSDHTNGLPTFFARVEVGELVLPDIEDDEGSRAAVEREANEYGIPITYVRDKTEFALGNACVKVFPPLVSGSDNEECLSVLCTCGEFDTLILGDMEKSSEKELLAYEALPATEVLLVAHHGSKTSTSDDLLDALQGKAGIISVGSNSYGHPNDRVLARLESADMDIYRTDQNGNITVAVH